MAMQPIRRGGNMFGRGGPLSIASTGAKLALGMIVATVLAVLLGDTVTLVLVPGQVIDQFALWQLVTFVPIELPQTLAVVFGALILWSIGGALEGTWGTRRLLWFLFGTVFASGVIGVLLSLVVTRLQVVPFYGGMVMVSIVWVAYGLSFGKGQVNFWGMPISGNMFALFGVGFVVLNAIFSSWQLMVPSFIGLAITYGYVRLGSPRVLILKLRQWRLQRELHSRSKHLRVVGRDRNTDKGSDRFLH